MICGIHYFITKVKTKVKTVYSPQIKTLFLVLECKLQLIGKPKDVSMQMKLINL